MKMKRVGFIWLLGVGLLALSMWGWKLSFRPAKPTATA
jgi:hypothetical protein